MEALIPVTCSGRRRNGQPCGRRIFDVDQGDLAAALRPGKRLALKCRDCNGLNSFTGAAA